MSNPNKTRNTTFNCSAKMKFLKVDIPGKHKDTKIKIIQLKN